MDLSIRVAASGVIDNDVIGNALSLRGWCALVGSRCGAQRKSYAIGPQRLMRVGLAAHGLTFSCVDRQRRCDALLSQSGTRGADLFIGETATWLS
jgi:hypothetical protein